MDKKNKKYFLITILALMMSVVCFAGSYSKPTFAKRLPQPAKVFIKEKIHNATIVITGTSRQPTSCPFW